MKKPLEIITKIKATRANAQKYLKNGDFEKYWRNIGKATAFNECIYEELKFARVWGSRNKIRADILDICILMLKNNYNNLGVNKYEM